MATISTREIIKALRCSAQPAEKETKCDGCPYMLLEESDPEIPCKPDVFIDGVGYWRSCDVDKMALDASDRLESWIDVVLNY